MRMNYLFGGRERRMTMNTICYSCIYCTKVEPHLNRPMEDCDDGDCWCDKDSENFQTEDGCYQYEGE